jgi:hypothetical protein
MFLRSLEDAFKDGYLERTIAVKRTIERGSIDAARTLAYAIRTAEFSLCDSIGELPGALKNV